MLTIIELIRLKTLVKFEINDYCELASKCVSDGDDALRKIFMNDAVEFQVIFDKLEKMINEN